jgi:hypothetical protein
MRAMIKTATGRKGLRTWNPSFDKDIIRILALVSSRVESMRRTTYNIEFVVDSVSIQSLDRKMSSRHFGVGGSAGINSLILFQNIVDLSLGHA